MSYTGTATQGNFAGVPLATLQAWLLEAQTAMHQLASGTKAVSLAYGQGDGSKSVTYTNTSLTNLQLHINALQAALGMGGTRRAVWPLFV